MDGDHSKRVTALGILTVHCPGMVLVLEMVIVTGRTTVIWRDDGRPKKGACSKNGECPYDCEGCHLDHLCGKEHYIMFIAKIWDKQADTYSEQCIELLHN